MSKVNKERIIFQLLLYLTSDGVFFTLISEGGEGGDESSPFFNLVKATEKVNFEDKKMLHGKIQLNFQFMMGV